MFPNNSGFRSQKIGCVVSLYWDTSRKNILQAGQKSGDCFGLRERIKCVYRG